MFYKALALPDDLYAVSAHFAIRGDERQLFRQGLADDQAIEGVAVVLVTGQAANQVNMLDFCLQDLYVKRCTGCLQVLSAGLLNAQFPICCLIMISQNEAMLTASELPPSRTAHALVESLSGVNSMSMSAQVSSRYFITYTL